jgi:alpha-1,3-rhamnosyl/mannosyltransferase
MSRLRVAIDARRLQDVPLGGVGRSMDGVLERVASEADVTLLTDARRDPAPSDLRQVALPVVPGAPESAWLQWSVARWLQRFDGVFHGTFNALPMRSPAPAVVTIHDLSWEVHPEGFTRWKRRVFQTSARHAARAARIVVTPSQHTRREVIQWYGVDPDRVVVTPWGVEARFSPQREADAPALCERLGVTGPYVVAMGGAPRRGLAVAIAAWRRLREEGRAVSLVAVGPEPVPADPGLVAAGYLDDDEWPVLLAGAEAFCYPTRYEGFGVPALEGLASGTPMVCAPCGALPEVLDGAAEWCTSATESAIAAGLRRVLDDPAHADALRAAGLRRAAEQPSWDDAADALVRAYHAAATSPPPR